MVFYFSTKAHKEGEDAWLIYMGKDKFENEDLIKHGWPVDVWCAVVDVLVLYQVKYVCKCNMYAVAAYKTVLSLTDTCHSSGSMLTTFHQLMSTSDYPIMARWT